MYRKPKSLAKNRREYKKRYVPGWEKGRFRNKHAGDCGVAKCGMCHYHKYPKRERSRNELESNLKLEEGLNGNSV